MNAVHRDQRLPSLIGQGDALARAGNFWSVRGVDRWRRRAAAAGRRPPAGRIRAAKTARRRGSELSGGSRQTSSELDESTAALVCGIVARAVHDVDRYRDARRPPVRPCLRGDRLSLRPARRSLGRARRTKPRTSRAPRTRASIATSRGVKTGSNGRHPLPIPQSLARTFGRLGIAGGVQVVVYDQDNGMYASRLWWLLRWMGHGSVAVLDGGLARWIGENRPLQSGIETRPPRCFDGFPHPGWTMTADEDGQRRRRSRRLAAG